MIVTCEGCETSFNVQDHKIKPTGSKVRCSKCRHVFVAYSSALVEPEKPLILQDVVPAAAVPEVPPERNEIDFGLDALLKGDAAEKSDMPSALMEPEFLNVGDLLDEEASTLNEATAHKNRDELKRDLDWGLSLEGRPAEDAAEEKITPYALSVGPTEQGIDFNLGSESDRPDASEEDIFALDDLEINLDDLGLFEETAKPAAEAGRPEDISDTKFELDIEKLVSESTDTVQDSGSDVDLSALLDSIGVDGKEDASPSVGAMDEPELELDLSLNETPPYQRAATEPLPDDESELDLSDLESILEDMGSGAELKPVGTEGIDLELDIQSAVPGDAPGGEMQELDLTSIAGPADANAKSADGVVEELDFSGLTGILDEKSDAADSEEPMVAGEEINLVFDEQPQPETVATEAKTSSAIEDGAMLDLEKLLEADEEKTPATPETVAQAANETGLQHATESIHGAADDQQIEIEVLADSEDFANGPSSTAETPAAVMAAAAAGAAIAAVAADRPVKPELRGADFSYRRITPAGVAADGLETEMAKPAAAMEQKATAAERSGGIPKLLWAVAALVVLAIAVMLIPSSLGIHLPFLRDLEVPFLGKIFQAEPEDTIGNLKMTIAQESISAEFVENVHSGRICVIRGQVRNNYDHPRSFLRVTGKLYDNNKNVVKMTTVFAGNVLSKAELSGQEVGAISARLKNREGANQLNVGIKPGSSIAFMIVFDALAENLDEYSVEVAGSSN